VDLAQVVALGGQRGQGRRCVGPHHALGGGLGLGEKERGMPRLMALTPPRVRAARGTLPA